jgi:hypothetical protein
MAQSIAQEFVNKFEIEYPHLFIQISLEEVSKFLEQPHIKQWDSNPDKNLVENFKLGLFADFVMSSGCVEVEF